MGRSLRREKSRKGFTLIELVIVIAVIGFLAAMAIPRLVDMRTSASDAGRDGVVGGIRAGIMVTVADNLNQGVTPFIPLDLDGLAEPVTCGPGVAACFTGVLTDGITDPLWGKVAIGGTTCPAPSDEAYTYSPPAGAGTAQTYCYDNGTGSFSVEL